jgi:hypothetical protein
MRWTTEPPTVPGWYWMRTPQGQIGCHLVLTIGNRMAIVDSWGLVCAAGLECEWSGPIPEPEEGER